MELSGVVLEIAFLANVRDVFSAAQDIGCRMCVTAITGRSGSLREPRRPRIQLAKRLAILLGPDGGYQVNPMSGTE